MKKFLVLLLVSMCFVPSVYAEDASVPSVAGAIDEAVDLTAKQYFCPMDGFTSDQPGKCELCGMDLIEKPADIAETAAGTETATGEEAIAGVLSDTKPAE